jgi:hypothetical protein
MRIVNLELRKGLQIEVTGEYVPMEPTVLYNPDGTGHPGSSAEFYTHKIELVQGELISLLDHLSTTTDFYDYLAGKCIDQIQKEDNG